MRRRRSALFSFFFLVVAAYAVLSARHWSFKAALFPLTVGMSLFLLAAAQLTMDLFGKSETAKGPAVDLEFSADVAPDVARRRVIAIFAWIAGFILLVFLLGFPLAVPLFIFSYLSLESRVVWPLALTLTAVAWGFFYGLFQRLLHLPFEAGWVQTWLGI